VGHPPITKYDQLANITPDLKPVPRSVRSPTQRKTR
jgi:hypothetical protein